MGTVSYLRSDYSVDCNSPVARRTPQFDYENRGWCVPVCKRGSPARSSTSTTCSARVLSSRAWPSTYAEYEAMMDEGAPKPVNFTAKGDREIVVYIFFRMVYDISGRLSAGGPRAWRRASASSAASCVTFTRRCSAASCAFRRRRAVCDLAAPVAARVGPRAEGLADRELNVPHPLPLPAPLPAALPPARMSGPIPNGDCTRETRHV